MRLASLADVPAIVDVHVAAWDAAEEGGAVRGFIAFGDSRDEDRLGEIEVYTLYVDPPRWDRGVGSALMATVPSDRPVSLWVAERNARAREFYARQGFTPDGARESGHHVPVIRLVRTQG